MAKTLEETIKALIEFRENMTTFIGNEMVNFALDNFQKQGFDDNGVQPWKPRKPGSPRDAGRAILVNKGRLRRGNRITRKTRNLVSVGNDAPYAKVHNDGGKIDTTANVGEYSRKRRGKAERVRAHSRKISFTMPRRRFMGKSAELDKRIASVLEQQLKKVFN